MSPKHVPVFQDLGPPHMSSVHFDIAPEVIIVPTREEAIRADPETYMRRINELQSPQDRLFELLKSVFSLRENPTHESEFIRNIGITGAFAGLIYGGLLRNTDATAEYVRKFNAATFEHRSLARRHYTDTFVRSTVGKGIKHLVLGGLLTSSAGLVAFSSIVYRNKLYYPDWALGFTTLGALTRFWSLGLRGAIGGGGFGLIGGSIGFAVLKLVEMGGGYPVSEIGYHHHLEYKQKREANRLICQRRAESHALETIGKMS